MIGLTESILRHAATWQAFKEGKSLLESRLVATAEATEAGWQGSVRSGSRLLKISVVMKSATNLETRCACPDNQRTGSVCCHAVATGLALLTPKTAHAPPPVAAPKPAAWQILLPLNWRDALTRGKLAATLALTGDEEVSPADEIGRAHV